MNTPPDPSGYTVRRASRSHFVRLRGLRYHLLRWGDASQITSERPPLLLLHGWMDVAASFQFMVDALATLEGEHRHIVALDWRGFGQTDKAAADCYWVPDYLGDLDAALDALFPNRAVDLLGHSMGGNVAMVYAGVRPERVRRLVNLEGFGMPQTRPSDAPLRYEQWLDELREPAELLPYDSLAEVAAKLTRNNPLLRPERAAWLAPHWAREHADGCWHIRADPAHKRISPALYQKAEILECWKRITAPVLWVEGDQTNIAKWWGKRYLRDEFYERLSVVPHIERHVLAPAGHMLHHDQPEALATRLRSFLDQP